MDKMQKLERNELLVELLGCGGVVSYFPENGTTILVVPGVPFGKTVKIAMAQASDNEPKIRRKMGELLVLRRWIDGVTISVKVDFLKPENNLNSNDQQDNLEFFANQFYGFVIGW